MGKKNRNKNQGSGAASQGISQSKESSGASSSSDKQVDGLRQDLKKTNEALGELSSGLEKVQSEVTSSLTSFHAEIKQVQSRTNPDIIKSLADEVVISQVDTVASRIGGRAEKATEKIEKVLGWVDEDVQAYRALVKTMPSGGLDSFLEEQKRLKSMLDEKNAEIRKLHSEKHTLQEEVSKLDAENYQLKEHDQRKSYDQLKLKQIELEEEKKTRESIFDLEQENIDLKTQVQQLRAVRHQEVTVREDLLEREQLEGEVHVLKSELVDINRNMVRTQREESRRLREIRDLEKERKNLAEQLKQLDSERQFQTERQERLMIYEASNQRLEESCQDLSATLADTKSQLSYAESEREKVELEFTKLKADTRNQEQKAKESARQDLRREFDERYEEYKQEQSATQEQIYRGKLEQLEAQKSRIEQEKEELSRDLDARRERSIDLNITIEELRQQVRDLDGERDQVLETANEEIRELRRSNLEEIRNEHDRLTTEKSRLDAEIESQASSRERLEEKSRELSASITVLTTEKATLEVQVRDLEQQREDLRHIDLPRQKRLGSLMEPCFSEDKLLDAAEPTEELVWLNKVRDEIRETGFVFKERLLHCFHTSLKCSKISPITVLAGISGTGKSELPRLYADFGGILFLNEPVQASWDSPEDLFGFFNYTDGRYRATQLAQALYQVSGDDNSPTSLSEHMVLVLLDEMNIARVEYYFSELLSKLETRRNLEKNHNDAYRASIQIDAGAGYPPEQLFLDHNMLFVGTMNEDESTLTLSDKVKDRANVITFPSPSIFEERNITSRDPSSHRLDRATWQKWVDTTAELSEEQQAEVDRIAKIFNEGLQYVGRAIGHRVYQAATAYIKSYPGVTKDDNRAFELALGDIFALKLVPKLEGIECRTQKGEQCLNRIKEIVPRELEAAFEQARDDDYFSWGGVRELFTHYADEAEEETAVTEDDSEEVDQTTGNESIAEGSDKPVPENTPVDVT